MIAGNVNQCGRESTNDRKGTTDSRLALCRRGRGQYRISEQSKRWRSKVQGPRSEAELLRSELACRKKFEVGCSRGTCAWWFHAASGPQFFTAHNDSLNSTWLSYCGRVGSAGRVEACRLAMGEEKKRKKKTAMIRCGRNFLAIVDGTPHFPATQVGTCTYVSKVIFGCKGWERGALQPHGEVARAQKDPRSPVVKFWDMAQQSQASPDLPRSHWQCGITTHPVPTTVKMKLRRTLNFHSLRKGVSTSPVHEPAPFPYHTPLITSTALVTTTTTTTSFANAILSPWHIESPHDMEQIQPLQPLQSRAHHSQLHPPHLFPAEMGRQGPRPRLPWRAHQGAKVAAHV